MSRQIIFFHSEIDTLQFIRVVLKSNAVILIKKPEGNVPAEANEIVAKMQTPSCNFSIVTNGGIAHSDAVMEGHAIQFRNSCKGNALSRTFCSGRLYITQDKNSNYSANLLIIYNKLIKFIKQNYHYSKEVGMYFAPDFWDKYDRHYYNALHGAWLIHPKD